MLKPQHIQDIGKYLIDLSKVVVSTAVIVPVFSRILPDMPLEKFAVLPTLLAGFFTAILTLAFGIYLKNKTS
jgi:hypothetical protein